MKGLNTLITKHLQSIEAIERFEVAGSFRRKKEMSKDLDYIISTNDPLEVQQQLLAIPEKWKRLL